MSKKILFCFIIDGESLALEIKEDWNILTNSSNENKVISKKFIKQEVNKLLKTLEVDNDMTDQNSTTIVVLLTELKNEISKINNRLDKIENHLVKIDNRLDVIENRLDVIETRLDKLETEFHEFKTEVNSRLDKIEDRLDRNNIL